MLPNKFKDQFFEKPWHAQTFAITVFLSEKGVFEWSEFSESLANQIKNDETLQRDGSDDYYNSWLRALERLLIKKKITNTSNMLKIKNLWVEAFLSTPHGKSVKIGD